MGHGQCDAIDCSITVAEHFISLECSHILQLALKYFKFQCVTSRQNQRADFQFHWPRWIRSKLCLDGYHQEKHHIEFGQHVWLLGILPYCHCFSLDYSNLSTQVFMVIIISSLIFSGLWSSTTTSQISSSLTWSSDWLLKVTWIFQSPLYWMSQMYYLS